MVVWFEVTVSLLREDEEDTVAVESRRGGS